MPALDRTPLSASSTVTASQYNNLASAALIMPAIVQATGNAVIRSGNSDDVTVLSYNNPSAGIRGHWYGAIVVATGAQASAYRLGRLYGGNVLIGLTASANAYFTVTTNAAVSGGIETPFVGTLTTAYWPGSAQLRYTLPAAETGYVNVGLSIQGGTPVTASAYIAVSQNATATAVVLTASGTANLNVSLKVATVATGLAYLHVYPFYTGTEAANFQLQSPAVHRSATAYQVPASADYIEMITGYSSGDRIYLQQSAAPAITANTGFFITPWR